MMDGPSGGSSFYDDPDPERDSTSSTTSASSPTGIPLTLTTTTTTTVTTSTSHPVSWSRRASHFPGAVRCRAYRFDGEGNYAEKEWDLSSSDPPDSIPGPSFCWYHVELPKRDQKLTLYAQYLIDALCPPLNLQEILALGSNGPYCGHVDGGALVFRVNSPGPPGSNYTLRLAARVTERSVITVSLGRVPRLGFSQSSRNTLLSEIPAINSCGSGGTGGGGDSFREGRDKGPAAAAAAAAGGARRTPIEVHVLEFFLTMNHSEEADNPVPKSVSNLIVHILDTHVDHVQDIVTNLEMELDSVELELDKGGFALKKQMLDDRRFAKLHLDLQRLLQAVAHSEQIFPRVKEKCASKSWLTNEDLSFVEDLIGRLRRVKENVGFIVNRVTAIQSGLDSWQSEQINRKLYYLSFLSMIFLPLSVITGIFGMNVGGVPWTGQKDPKIKDGFRNVMLLCAAIFLVLLVYFGFHAVFTRISAWRRRISLNRSLSLNRKQMLKKAPSRGRFPSANYIPI